MTADRSDADSLLNIGRDGPGPTRRVAVAGVPVGAREVAVIAGPCAVESRTQTLEVAEFLAALGVRLLRAGAYKPRTSPHTFQGLGEEGLEILEDVRERTGLGIVTEVLDRADLPLVAATADCLQIGARSMQNIPLLRAVGEQDKPVLLKRGMHATLVEWLLAAEHIAKAGNRDIILCERGIRTFADHARNTLDLSVVPAVRRYTDLPVIVDPSHGAGRADIVPDMAAAAIAAGADGLLVEVHGDPTTALSDGPQQLTPEAFAAALERVRAVATAVGRTCGAGRPSEASAESE